MEAFWEFDYRFSQLTDQDQELVGADKVPLFLKSINERRRMAIFPYLEDDKGAYGLTEDWNKVEWACQQYDDVGKHVPPDGRYREPADLRTGPDRFRPIGRTHVNSPKVIYV